MPDRYRDRPFPPGESFDRDEFEAAERSTNNSDPLAELARLIGQTDPFSTFGRADQQQQPSQGTQYDQHDDAEGYRYEAQSTPSWMRNRAPAQDASYGDHDHHDAGGERGYRQMPQFGYQEHGYQHSPAPVPTARQPQPQQPQDAARYEDVLYGKPDRDPRQDTRYAAPRDDYNDNRYEQDYDDGADADAPRARRGGTMTVVVVLLLAVVGTAAAFGYRTFVGSPRSGEPPVIKADAGPTKVIPAGSSDGKVNDRVGDRASERVVSREEQPVDINGKAQPRVVFPPLTQNANPPNAASANTATRPTGAGVGNGTLSGGEEPRKIRTLTIRPEGEAAASPATDTATPPPPRNVQTTPRAAPPASTASTSAPSSGAPMALTPQSQAAAPAAEPRARVAAVAPATGGGGSGSYVQISSQKTEADAQASFRAMQAKYSGILGSRSPSIRRADLGEKGVFYRALVGPFGTTDEATQFCVNLKSAGGQCIVQR